MEYMIQCSKRKVLCTQYLSINWDIRLVYTHTLYAMLSELFSKLELVSKESVGLYKQG